MRELLKGFSEHTQPGLGSDIECLKTEHSSLFLKLKFKALFVSILDGNALKHRRNGTEFLMH